MVLIVDATENDLNEMQARLQSNADNYNFQSSDMPAITFSTGIITVTPESSITMEELLSQADKAMYEHKQRRRRIA